MEVKDIPIQAVIAIVGSLLAIISGLILLYLTRLVNEVKELKQEIAKLEAKKMDSLVVDLKFDLIKNMFEQLMHKQDTLIKEVGGFGRRVDERLADHDRQLAQLSK